MSIWTRISAAVATLAKGAPLSDVFAQLSTPPERSVGFTIAVIALGAKMAKADGQVTRDEVTAFKEVFQIAQADEAGAAKVFNLARQDATGFEAYATRVRDMFGAGHEALHDLLEGLFHIALADGMYHPNEDAFLQDVADIFGLNERGFRQIRSRFVPEAEADPYSVLGVDPDASLGEIKQAWRALVRESHPDQMIARGLPQEAVKMAEKRMIAINKAWEEISERRE